MKTNKTLIIAYLLAVILGFSVFGWILVNIFAGNITDTAFIYITMINFDLFVFMSVLSAYFLFIY